MPKLSKKQWILAGVLLLVLIGVGVYLYLEYRKKTKAAGSSLAPDAPVIPMFPETPVKLFSDCPNDSFPLKYGKCGKRVEQFQIYLIKTYGAQFSQYGVDGKWGDETEALANKFIQKNAPFSISEDYFTKTGMGYITTVKYA